MKNYATELKNCQTTTERTAVIRKYCTYQGTKEQTNILFNLAKTGHLRWCAMAALMGYVPYYENIQEEDVCLYDTMQKKHARMVDIQTMQTIPSLQETIPFDYTIVDICLYMANGMIFGK